MATSFANSPETNHFQDMENSTDTKDLDHDGYTKRRVRQDKKHNFQIIYFFNHPKKRLLKRTTPLDDEDSFTPVPKAKKRTAKKKYSLMKSKSGLQIAKPGRGRPRKKNPPLPSILPMDTADFGEMDEDPGSNPDEGKNRKRFPEFKEYNYEGFEIGKGGEDKISTEVYEFDSESQEVSIKASRI